MASNQNDRYSLEDNYSLCHIWGSNLKYSDPDSIRRVATAAGDLLDNLLNDPLTLCAGTLRTKAFTIYKTCEGGEMSK